MKNKKLFYSILIITLFIILATFFFYIKDNNKLLSEINLIKICEETGGVFTKKGTEEECRGLDVEECYENKNCVFKLGNWTEPPGESLTGCREIRTCKCPNNTRFYPDLGCIK